MTDAEHNAVVEECAMSVDRAANRVRGSVAPSNLTEHILRENYVSLLREMAYVLRRDHKR